MNYVLSVITPAAVDQLLDICARMQLAASVLLFARGTALKSMLEFVGLQSRARRIVLTPVPAAHTARFLSALRKELQIGTRGIGIAASIPMKSVGGRKVLDYLRNGTPQGGAPSAPFPYELILAIANEGHVDEVMEAARTAGASGGTILHGKGTGSKQEEKFYQLSIAREKEVLLIVAKREQKAAIMRAILQQAGPDSPAGSVVFTLPVNEVAGLTQIEDPPEGSVEPT